KLMVELEIEQLAHFSPEELAAIDALVDELAASGEAPTQERLALLRERHTAADIALFGRMLASSPKYNTEAAAQVAHAISVHKVTVEDDFFTAVDDLNNGEEDMGAGHMGETEFAAGLFYQYICIDRDLLRKNLSGDTELADKTLDALIRAAATVAPCGKQNSFASRARASYILCERGEAQPRSLSVAFLKPVAGQD
ncbi:CRISPR-associated protein Cse4, partial [Candidatus Endoriftia persephone str. Guaymas]|nr:CRISPR-associated protein Cse4 [Candidatus Endoriftia persephone str. Guaymas]